MPYFLTNGEVAWEIPARVGRFFWDGLYQTPPGWSVITSLQGHWHNGDCGKYRRPQTSRKLLREAAAGGH